MTKAPYQFWEMLSQRGPYFRRLFRHRHCTIWACRDHRDARKAEFDKDDFQLAMAVRTIVVVTRSTHVPIPEIKGRSRHDRIGLCGSAIRFFVVNRGNFHLTAGFIFVALNPLPKAPDISTDDRDCVRPAFLPRAVGEAKLAALFF